MFLGTTRYMSPEQAMAQQVDARSDLWSLGVVLYEMVAGRAPFEGETATDVIAAISERDPQPLKRAAPIVSLALQSVVDRCLRKDPAERYQTAEEMLSDLRAIKEKTDGIAARSARWIAVAALAAVAAMVGGLALFYAWRDGRTAPAHATAVNEKSVAVLPFENLSKDEENAFFTGGVQDEILTDLAKIADLKVISRTSVMKYKSDLERNLREIATTLGVSHVVEGSVQRAAGRVRVNVQLIDARNDAQLWAEHYDRDVADVFAIQSEIAKTIAEQLHAKLSPAEKAAIAERPTADPVAYAYYTEAINSSSEWEGEDKSLSRQIELLEQATQRDPNFALAYCALAKAHEELSDVTHYDSKHVELAKKAAEAAVRLRPDLGESHLALARNYFWAGLPTADYDRARDELTIALRMLPNNSEALLIAAKIDRHQNRWESALTTLQKANSLDPNNGEIAVWLGETYFEMRRYSEWEQLIKEYAARGRAKGPWMQVVLAKIKLAQGDPAAAQFLLEQVPLEFSPNEIIWNTRFKAAVYLRDCDAANQMIAATPAKFGGFAFDGPSSWAEGQVARARGDNQKAVAAFAAARKKVDAIQADKPKDASDFADVARLDAGLGRKEEAIREAQRAVEIQPIAKDSLNGPTWVANLALVYAWTGERDRALEQLERVATVPGLAPTYGDLLLNPCWDDLRGDSRFDKIVAAAKAASK
jgi:TolB-like protein/Flp pilus assembly protein TadD